MMYEQGEWEPGRKWKRIPAVHLQRLPPGPMTFEGFVSLRSHKVGTDVCARERGGELAHSQPRAPFEKSP